MANFKYIAVDTKGHRLEGTVEMLSLEEAGHEVRKMGLKIISIIKVKSKRKKLKFSEINLTPPKIDLSLKVIFFRELATLMNAGIQLVDGLSILKLQFKDKHFVKAIESITKMVKAGHPFSEALKQHPRIFPRLVVSLIKAAELGAGLVTILNQIASYIEREEKIRKKLKTATSYPRFVLGFFTLVLAGVVFGLLPKFKDIFESFDAELPASTTALLAGSTFIREHLIIEIVLIVGLIIAFKMFKKSNKGRNFIDQHIFKLPIAGSLMHKSMITRMMQTLCVLLKSGVPLITALKIAGETADNVYVDKVVGKIGKQVAQGRSFGSQVQKYPDIFPTMVSSMIAVGEKSGSLALMIEKIAEFNDQDFSAKVDRISETIEPIMMAGLGVVICIIVLALYLPIFQMSGAIK